MIRMAKDLYGNSKIEKGLLLKRLGFKSVDGYVNLIGVTLSVLMEENALSKELIDVIEGIFKRFIRISNSRKVDWECYNDYIRRVLVDASDDTVIDYNKYKDLYLLIREDMSLEGISLSDYVWYLKDEEGTGSVCLESLKNQISGATISSRVLSDRYLSFDNLDVEFVYAYNILNGILIWVLNSNSMRKGELQAFDKYEIEYQLNIIDTIYFSPLGRVS